MGADAACRSAFETLATLSECEDLLPHLFDHQTTIAVAQEYHRTVSLLSYISVGDSNDQWLDRPKGIVSSVRR